MDRLTITPAFSSQIQLNSSKNQIQYNVKGREAADASIGQIKGWRFSSRTIPQTVKTKRMRIGCLMIALSLFQGE